MDEELCLSCGRDTRPGTRLFSARRRGRDTETGREGFLCPVCQPGSGARRDEPGVPLSGRYVVIDLPGGYPS